MVAQPKLPVKVPIALRQQKNAGKQSVPFLEKLSTALKHELHTDCTCIVQLCRCNPHAVCGGKGKATGLRRSELESQPARGAWRQRSRSGELLCVGVGRNLYAVRGGKGLGWLRRLRSRRCNPYAICGGEAGI